jgi:SIR2-like domain
MAIPPKQLLESLENKKCMLFVGSGLSIAAGYPSWPELIEKLVEEAAAAYPEKAKSLKQFAATQKNPLLVAEYAREKLGAYRYGDLLRGLLSLKAKPQPAHKHIANTDYRAIVTTNYDKLIEFSITVERGWIPTVFTFESMESLGSALYSDQFFVLKMHGDLSAPGSIILTSQDYDRLMLRSPYVRSFMQAIFLNFTLLFVGYSLTDPDFQLVLKELNLIFQGTTPPHYALLPDPHDFTSEHLMKSMNIQVIPYSSKHNHREATEFLGELRKAVPLGVLSEQS